MRVTVRVSAFTLPIDRPRVASEKYQSLQSFAELAFAASAPWLAEVDLKRRGEKEGGVALDLLNVPVLGWLGGAHRRIRRYPVIADERDIGSMGRTIPRWYSHSAL